MVVDKIFIAETETRRFFVLSFFSCHQPIFRGTRKIIEKWKLEK